MPLEHRTYAIGPGTGSLQLTTTRQGVAGRLGHDLLIVVQSWSGRVTWPDDRPTTARVQVDADLGSLLVVAGSGGATPLGAHDRDEITRTALRLLDVEQYRTAMFRSTRVVASGSGGSIEGTLSVRDTTAPLVLDVEATGPASWRGTATVRQSAFGIPPYRAFLGALRLADAVGVEVAVDLSG